jgi:PAS domain S-box-containing protein
MSAVAKVERAADERGHLLDAIFHLLPSHVFVLDADGVITYLSSSWEKFTGAKHDWFDSVSVGTNYLDACQKAAEKNSCARDCLDGISGVASGDLPSFSAEYVCHSPTDRWFAVRMNPTPWRNGGVIISHTDITERKKEEAFQEGQKRVLEMIAASAPLPEVLTGILNFIEPQSQGMLCSILLLDGDGTHVRHGAAPNLPEGYIRAVDGAPIGPRAGSCGTAMYRAQQVIVTDISENPLWEDYRGLAEMFGLRACWSTPILSHKGKVLGSFAMYYHEPRSPKAEELRLTGVATHLAGIAIERQQSEQALKRSEERYRNIVDTAYEGIWVLDKSYRVVFVNRRMSEMLGYTVDEMMSRPIRDFVDYESSEHAREQIEGCQTSTGQCDLRFRRKDGSELWGILSTTPVWDEEGQPGGALGMVTDITERKHSEQELRRSSEEIRELAGKLITAQEEERRRISRELHDDIVQKVASLAIKISMVKRQVPASADSLAGEIATIQQRVSGLADDIRQLSHQLHPAVLEHAGLNMALKSFTAEFSCLEGVDVELTVPETNEEIPRDIAVCVYRIVQESLRNVAKHSGAKSAEVTLSIADSHLHLSVRDEGRGFDVDHRRSSGLGMVSVEERIRLCRGTVEVTSQLNCGTALKARIPLSHS